MKIDFYKQINLNIENIIKEKNNGLIHYTNVFSREQIYDLQNKWEKQKFAICKDGEKVARYEIIPLQIVCEINKELDELILVLNKKFSYGFSTNVESYGLKYIKDNYIPWHKDIQRHKISILYYFGEFTGGEYVYKNSNNSESIIKPNNNDILISINELTDGTVINPLHKVNPIKSGIRNCLVKSLVSKIEDLLPYN